MITENTVRDGLLQYKTGRGRLGRLWQFARAQCKVLIEVLWLWRRKSYDRDRESLVKPLHLAILLLNDVS